MTDCSKISEWESWVAAAERAIEKRKKKRIMVEDDELSDDEYRRFEEYFGPFPEPDPMWYILNTVQKNSREDEKIAGGRKNRGRLKYDVI